MCSGIPSSNTQKRMYLLSVEQVLPESKLSRKFRMSFELYRTFYRAIQFYWKGYKRPFSLKDIIDMRISFLRNPVKFTTELKALFNSFRSEVFSRSEPLVNSLRYFFNGAVSDTNKLQSAACMRSLPRYEGELDSHIAECIKRYTTLPEKQIDLSQWESWIKEWCKFYAPYVPVSRFPIILGTGACLEYSRSKGGITKAALELMKRTLSPEMDKEFNKALANVKMVLLSTDLDVYRKNYFLIYSCLDVLAVPIKHARTCKEGCKLQASHPPMCVLALAERGFKVRLPTMTIAPIVILSKILRQVADAYLRSDPRISPSLKGNFIKELPFKFSGGYRSQDLTVATDHHHPEMTRMFYKCINPGVPWWDDVVNVVCNYYTIFEESDLKYYRVNIAKYSDTYIWDKSLDSLNKLGMSSYIKKYTPEYTEEADFNWARLHYKGRVTCRGQPMGIASSWPLLPLVSLFAFETSSLYKKVEVERKVGIPLPTDALYYYRVLNHEHKTKIVKRQVPVNFMDIRTTGDDAVMTMTQNHSILHTQQLEKLGSLVNKTKDYFSYAYALYTEIIYLDGKVLPIVPIGPYLAPESIRQCTWYSQPDALIKLEENFGFKVNRKLSTYSYIWEFLEDLGCPLFAPRFLGGLGLPGPHKNARRLTRPIKLLLFEEFKNFCGLDKDLPISNLEELGKIMRPLSTDATEFKEYLKVTLHTPKSRGVPADLSRRTVSVPSPGLMMSYQTWNAIYKSQFSWEQISREQFLVEEPSIASFIRRFSKVPRLSLSHVNQFVEEYAEEFEEQLEVPWGLAKLYKPSLCFPLPRADEPRFYFTNKNLDLRTAILEIEGEN